MRLPAWSRNSVRLRLTLWNVGVLALVLSVLGVALPYTLQAGLIRGVDQDLARMAEPPRREGRPPLPGPPFPSRTFPNRPRGWRGPPDNSRRLLDPHGHPLLPFLQGPEWAAWDPKTALASAQGQRVYSTIQNDGEPMRVLSVPLRRESRIIGEMQVARPLIEVYDQVRSVSHALLGLIPLALLIAGIGGAFLTDRVLRPVRQITQAAGQIEAVNLSGRLPVMGGDEFAELAATFNGMLGRLDESFTRLTWAYEQQRRFTADASHELRTPLTIIKANTSLALLCPRSAIEYRQALETVDRAADRTNRIVQDLLLLARSDAGQMRLKFAPLPIRDVLAQASEASHGPESAPVIFDIPDPELSIMGDADALARLFGNLLTNAARHTPPDGGIVIAAEARGEQVIVSVADTGEGIPPEHLPHVCERFYRVDAARSGAHGGTGLGLAICQSIAEAHGGTLTVTSVFGAGVTVTVTLPGAF